jgi:polyisoprenoid-binding protein YceI
VHAGVNVGAFPEGATVRYAVDPKSSNFVVHVTAGGWMSAFGHSPDIAIRRFSGEIWVDPVVIERSSVTLRIDSASLEMASKASDKDRREIERTMHEDVLNSEGYPEIVFECSQITASAAGEGRYWAALNGELTLRGIVHSQKISASVAMTEAGLRATGDFSVRQTDFDIKPISVLGGGLVVKDELKFSFDILARKS